MPQLRYDIFSGTYTIIASERGKRPNDYRGAQETEHSVPELDPKCPFCPGNEDQTPPEIQTIPRMGSAGEHKWNVRVVPNKFPALIHISDTKHSSTEIVKPPALTDDSAMYWETEAIGAHEVVIESPKHNGTLGSYTVDEMVDILTMLKERYLVLYDSKPIKYVQIFRNWGKAGGASLAHPHFQIIALPFIPPEVHSESRRYKEYRDKTGRCLMCDYVERELEKDVRVASKGSEFVALCPFASRFSFESIIVPKKHSSIFSDLSLEEYKQLAEQIIGLFSKYEQLFTSLSYNLVFHSLPPSTPGKNHGGYHWHIHIYPRLNIEAGLEKSSGVWINPTSPELAALQFNEKDGA